MVYFFLLIGCVVFLRLRLPHDFTVIPSDILLIERSSMCSALQQPVSVDSSGKYHISVYADK